MLTIWRSLIVHMPTQLVGSISLYAMTECVATSLLQVRRSAMLVASCKLLGRAHVLLLLSVVVV